MGESTEWRRGLPPDADVDKWDVRFTAGGAIWYRPADRLCAQQKEGRATPTGAPTAQAPGE